VNIVRIAAFARISALASAIWTSLFAAGIVGWQALVWTQTGEWRPLPISNVLAMADIGRPPICLTASTNPSYVQLICAWLLDLPASGVLWAVAAVLVALSRSAALIEKKTGLDN
jgi:hypothetical protein